MTNEAATKFAKALLEQFGKERVFQFEMPEGHNAELVVAALKQNGCEVHTNEETGAFIVKVLDTVSS